MGGCLALGGCLGAHWTLVVAHVPTKKRLRAMPRPGHARPAAALRAATADRTGPAGVGRSVTCTRYAPPYAVRPLPQWGMRPPEPCPSTNAKAHPDPACMRILDIMRSLKLTNDFTCS